MGLNAALVDRARVKGKAATATRVEGATVYEDSVTAWFRARLTLQQSPGIDAPATGAPETVMTPMMLCGVTDTAGKPILINGADRVEIESAELGNDLWDVVGDPEPLRKKRRLIGWQVALKRVVVHGTKGF